MLSAVSLAAVIGPCVRIRDSAELEETTAAPPARKVPGGLEASLPSGFTITVHGEFTQRETMWPDASLMFSNYRDIYVLDGGQSKPRLVHHNDDNYGVMLDNGTAISADRTRVFTWIDPLEQLSTIDLTTGQMESLTDLPTVTGVEFRRGLEPYPVARPRGVIEDASGRLCFVIQAHSPARQQTTPRTMGHRILAVDPATHDLSQSSDFPGTASAWDYSTSRQIVYLLVSRDDTAWLVMRRLDGTLVREVPLREHVRVAGRLTLSPDESTLLIERKTPLLDAGFLFIDTSTFDVRDGPARGQMCSWSPDGGRIAYHEGWELRIWDVAAGQSSSLVTRRPSTSGESPEYCAVPTWSEDGRRLAVRLGYDRSDDEGKCKWAAIAMDLGSRELLVLRGDLDSDGLTWLPVPHPFDPAHASASDLDHPLAPR
jgi:hypothetical protein